MAQVLEDLATRLGHPVPDASVVMAEQVSWPDGSMGCPQRGVMYTQMVVPGYHVIVRADDQDFDYRLSERGVVRRCDEPPRPSGLGG